MTGVAVYAGVVLLAIALVWWGRRVWRKHDEEAIYEANPESESHKKDPFFQERFGEGLHGGPGGPGP